MRTQTSPVNGSSFHNARHYDSTHGVQSEIEKYLYLFDQPHHKTTQQIIDEMNFPELKGFKVIQGKINDTLVGGNGNPALIIKRRNTPIKISVRKPVIPGHDDRGFIPLKDQMVAFNNNFTKKHFGKTSSHCELFLGLLSTKIVTVELDLKELPVKNRIEFVYHPDQPRYFQNFEKEKSSFKLNKEDLAIISSQALVSFGALNNFLHEKNIRAIATETMHGVKENGIYNIGDLYSIDNTSFDKLDKHGNPIKKLGSSTEIVNEIAPGKKPFTKEERILIARRLHESVSGITGSSIPVQIKSWEDRLKDELTQVLFQIFD